MSQNSGGRFVNLVKLVGEILVFFYVYMGDKGFLISYLTNYLSDHFLNISSCYQCFDNNNYVPFVMMIAALLMHCVDASRMQIRSQSYDTSLLWKC